eukprot:5293107-Prymnesium_polylepis.1
MSYRFQYACWAGIVERSTGGKKQPRGNTAIKELAVALFGAKAAWCARAITDAVKAGKDSPGEAASRYSYPKELEDELLYFLTKLRQLKITVTKTTVLDYAMRLIGPHEAALNFAQIGDDGEY